MIATAVFKKNDPQLPVKVGDAIEFEGDLFQIVDAYGSALVVHSRVHYEIKVVDLEHSWNDASKLTCPILRPERLQFVF